MKRLLLPIVLAVVALLAAAPVHAQATFKIPFKFESGGKKLTAGDYTVAKSGNGQMIFKQLPSGKETILSFTETLKPPQPKGEAGTAPPAPGPLLVFDEVGNFEPSYTEYFTVYVVAQVWLSADEGYLIHTTKGAHKTKLVAATR